jgi:imidazolonepropionase-like amidohydrolase
MTHVVALLLQVVAIKAGRVVDPDAGTVATNRIIVVENGRIKSIGASGPADAKTIDLSNETVLPGLFDVHSHLCSMVSAKRNASPSRRNLFTISLMDTTGLRAIQGVANARSMLDSGFTTVRDVGNAGNYADTDLRHAIEMGLVPGPTIVNAGRIIAPFGGQFHLQPEKRGVGEPEYFYADTHDEMLKAVRENIHFGARVIKIVMDDQKYIYSREDVRFIVEEAKRWGLKVAAHCVTDAGCRNAAQGGVASVEHVWNVNDDTLKIIKQSGAVFVPTDEIERHGAEGVPDERAQEKYRRHLERLKHAHALGLTQTMAYGTDTAFDIDDHTRGQFSMACTKPFAEAGIPARVVLRAMTANAARLVGVEKERGALKPGMAADLIAVHGNPLDDIRTLDIVVFVMKNGSVIKAR